jgi:catechol 2,3-dioxygenase-like lactoylglutathione lyase family enzyme
MSDYISGIQQVGIGVGNAQKAKHYYKALFGMDVLVFEDIAEASLMTRYTGNELHSREAILTLNMQGGGGFEIWQFLTKEPCFYLLLLALYYMPHCIIRLKSLLI